MSGHLQNKDWTLDISEITASLLLPFAPKPQNTDRGLIDRVLIAAMDKGHVPLTESEKNDIMTKYDSNHFWTTLSEINYLEPARACLVIYIEHEDDAGERTNDVLCSDAKFSFLTKQGSSEYCYEPFGTGDGIQNNYYANSDAMKLLFNLFNLIVSKVEQGGRQEAQYKLKLDKYPRDVEKLVIALDEILIRIFQDRSSTASSSNKNSLFMKVTQLIMDEMSSLEMKSLLDNISSDVKIAFEKTKENIKKIATNQMNGYVFLCEVFRALCPIRLQLLDKSTLLPVVARALIMHGLDKNNVHIPHMENCLRLLTQNDSRELLRTNTLQADLSLIATVNKFCQFFQYKHFILTREGNTNYHFNFSKKEKYDNDFGSMCIELANRDVTQSNVVLKGDSLTKRDFLHDIKTDINFENSLIMTELVLYPSIKAILHYSILEMQQNPFMLSNLYGDVHALLESHHEWVKIDKDRSGSKKGKRKNFKKTNDIVKGKTFSNSDEIVHGFCDILTTILVNDGKLKKTQFHKEQAVRIIVPKEFNTRSDNDTGFYAQFQTGLQNAGRAKNLAWKKEHMADYWTKNNISLIVQTKNNPLINPILAGGCEQFEKHLFDAQDSGKIEEILFFSRFCWNPNTVETLKNLTDDSAQDPKLKRALEDPTLTRSFFRMMNHTFRQSITTMAFVQNKEAYTFFEDKDRHKLFQILTSRTLIHLPSWIVNVLQDKNIRDETETVYQKLEKKGCHIHFDSSLDIKKSKNGNGKTLRELLKYLNKRDDNDAKVQNLLRPLHLLNLCMFSICALFQDWESWDCPNQPKNKRMKDEGWKYFMKELALSPQTSDDGEVPVNPLLNILRNVLDEINKSFCDDADNDDGDDGDDSSDDDVEEGTLKHAETFLFNDGTNELEIFENILLVGAKGKKKKSIAEINGRSGNDISSNSQEMEVRNLEIPDEDGTSLDVDNLNDVISHSFSNDDEGKERLDSKKEAVPSQHHLLDDEQSHESREREKKLDDEDLNYIGRIIKGRMFEELNNGVSGSLFEVFHDTVHESGIDNVKKHEIYHYLGEGINEMFKEWNVNDDEYYLEPPETFEKKGKKDKEEEEEDDEEEWSSGELSQKRKSSCLEQVKGSKDDEQISKKKKGIEDVIDEDVIDLDLDLS